jgi:hypothetical protein
MFPSQAMLRSGLGNAAVLPAKLQSAVKSTFDTVDLGAPGAPAISETVAVDITDHLRLHLLMVRCYAVEGQATTSSGKSRQRSAQFRKACLVAESVLMRQLAGLVSVADDTDTETPVKNKLARAEQEPGSASTAGSYAHCTYACNRHVLSDAPCEVIGFVSDVWNRDGPCCRFLDFTHACDRHMFEDALS